MVVDLLAEQLRERFKSGARGFADVVETRLGAERVVLAKPRSYMNESGGAVKAVLGFYKVTPEQLVVIHDELDIPFRPDPAEGRWRCGWPQRHAVGRLRAGHPRLRPGPGRHRPSAGPDGAGRFVLRDFGPGERKELPLLFERGADAVETLLRDGLAAAQNLFHGVG